MWRAALAGPPPQPWREAVLVHIVRDDGRRLRVAGAYARPAIAPPASLPAFLDSLIALGDFNAGGVLVRPHRGNPRPCSPHRARRDSGQDSGTRHNAPSFLPRFRISYGPLHQRGPLLRGRREERELRPGKGHLSSPRQAARSGCAASASPQRMKKRRMNAGRGLLGSRAGWIAISSSNILSRRFDEGVEYVGPSATS